VRSISTRSWEPQIRQLVWYEFGKDPEHYVELVKRMAPAAMTKFERPALAYARGFTALRFRATDAEEAEKNRGKVLAALDRLDEGAWRRRVPRRRRLQRC